jgi:NAD dependent epimerase/dehydratase family enzyme
MCFLLYARPMMPRNERNLFFSLLLFLARSGEPVLNPLQRWTPAFQAEVRRSRVDLTRDLATAVARHASGPDKACSHLFFFLTFGKNEWASRTQDQAQPSFPFTLLCFFFFFFLLSFFPLSLAVAFAKVMVAMSGIGYYVPRADPAPYTEEDAGGTGDSLSRLCVDWEAAATAPGVRTVCLRTTNKQKKTDKKYLGTWRLMPPPLSFFLSCPSGTGVVLGRDGGAFQQMQWPFYLGVGGRMGSGTQPFPWIHVSDLAEMAVFALEQQSLSGPLNGVAPGLITNSV